MDKEDQDHFKTIASHVAKQQTALSKPTSAASSQSPHVRASCLAAARAIFGCYRRDEAHDPEGFVAGLTAILTDYPEKVVGYVADPRTGVAKEYPNGLPNIGQIKEFCDVIEQRQATMAKPSSKSVPYQPPPLKPNEITYAQFLERCEKLKLEPRPIGCFEQDSPKGNRGGGQTAAEKDQLKEAIIKANKALWEREHKVAGTDPATSVISPSLRKLIERQNAERAEDDKDLSR